MSLIVTAIAKSLEATVTASRLVGAFTKGLFLKILEIADSFSVSEALSKAFSRPVSDSSVATDAEAKEVGKNTTDASSVSDDDVIEFGKNPSDSFALTDDIDTIAFGKNPSDIPVISEDHRFDLTKLLTDQIYATDDLDGEASIQDDQEMQFTKVRSDISFASESFSRVVSFDREFADSGSVSENQITEYGKNLTEAPSVAESFSRVFIVNRTFTEAPTATESYASSFGRPLADGGFVGESEVKSVGKNTDDSAISADSGSLRSQNYTVDNSYFAEDYVGESRTFT